MQWAQITWNRSISRTRGFCTSRFSKSGCCKTLFIVMGPPYINCKRQWNGLLYPPAPATDSCSFNCSVRRSVLCKQSRFWVCTRQFICERTPSPLDWLRHLNMPQRVHLSKYYIHGVPKSTDEIYSIIYSLLGVVRNILWLTLKLELPIFFNKSSFSHFQHTGIFKT